MLQDIHSLYRSERLKSTHQAARESIHKNKSNKNLNKIKN